MKLNSLSSLNLTECDERWQRRLVRPLPPLAGAVLGINQHSSSQPIMLPLDSRYCRYYWVLVLTTSAATRRYISISTLDSPLGEPSWYTGYVQESQGGVNSQHYHHNKDARLPGSGIFIELLHADTG